MSDDGKSVPCPRCEGAGRIPLLKSRGFTVRVIKGAKGLMTHTPRRIIMYEGCNVCLGSGRVTPEDELLWLQTSSREKL